MKNNHQQEEKRLDKKMKRREKKKNVKMKVSGAGMKKLAKQLNEKQ